MFQFQALVWPNSNDCLSALYITLLIPCLCTQAYTLGYCEWAFVRLLNRPLCLVSRLKVYREKRPFTLLLLGWNSRYLCVMKILQFLIITSHSLYTFISTVNGVWHEKKMIEEEDWGFCSPAVVNIILYVQAGS